MKFSYKKTILVGFAFFLICAFWQAYDKAIPLILKDRYNMSEALSGFIMALDNILAVVLLPLFGTLSDKSRNKFGRRTPYILVGTVVAVAFFLVLPWVKTLWIFIVVLLAILLGMSLFRSPAVALMPDVTCKPFRSKGNAIINLMGAAGGAVILVVGMIVGSESDDMLPYIYITCGVMILALIIFLLTVKEKKWAAEMERDTLQYFPEEEKQQETVTKSKLTKPELISFLFILASVILWYMGYNAVTSKYSLYARDVLNQSYDLTMIIAQVAAIITYIPIGLIASRVGRKKTIIAGVLILFAAFFAAIFVREGSSVIFMYVVFALAGVGWATINVNSFPMAVELAKSGDVGKFTGYYYTASMAAQVVTPILSGLIMDAAGNMYPLFPYAAVCVGLAFVTMLFVRHGDNKPTPPKSKMEMLAGSDD